MHLRIGIVALVALALASQRPNLFAAQDPLIKFYGVSSDSCGVWTADSADRTSLRAQVQKWWVLGFVSGASTILATDNNVAIAETDVPGIEGWITKYCSDHPLDKIATATMKLVGELRARASKPR